MPHQREGNLSSVPAAPDARMGRAGRASTHGATTCYSDAVASNSSENWRAGKVMRLPAGWTDALLALSRTLPRIDNAEMAWAITGSRSLKASAISYG